MNDYEGSRSEFLRLLAEMGEEPAFLARARAPQIALDALLHACDAKRRQLLEWPTFRLAALERQVDGTWARLSGLVTPPDSVALLETLHANLRTEKAVPTNWLASDRSALRQFLQSANRFNRKWRAFLDGLALDDVNQPRRDYNQFYVVEMDCAFGKGVAEGFTPLPMIDEDYLSQRFPLLALPSLA